MFPLPPEGEPSKEGLTPEQNEALDKVANKVVSKRLTVPAIMFLESVKPLNFIGSQVMVFFEPIVQTLFEIKGYNAFREAMERRENVEVLMQKIEYYDSRSQKLEKAYKVMKREHLRGKSFWFKFKTWIIGYRVPVEELKEFSSQLEEKEKQEKKSKAEKYGKMSMDDKNRKDT